MPCSQSWQRLEWVGCFVFKIELRMLLNDFCGTERAELQILQIVRDCI
jgi:hypothetical protein